MAFGNNCIAKALWRYRYSVLVLDSQNDLYPGSRGNVEQLRHESKWKMWSGFRRTRRADLADVNLSRTITTSYLRRAMCVSEPTRHPAIKPLYAGAQKCCRHNSTYIASDNTKRCSRGHSGDVMLTSAEGTRPRPNVPGSQILLVTVTTLQILNRLRWRVVLPKTKQILRQIAGESASFSLVKYES